MPSLTIRNLPEDVMESLRDAARIQHRSLNAQVLYWLEIEAHRWGTWEKRVELFNRIDAGRQAILSRHGRLSDSTKMIREMRDGGSTPRRRRAGR